MRVPGVAEPSALSMADTCTITEVVSRNRLRIVVRDSDRLLRSSRHARHALRRQELTAGGIDRDQAEVIANAMRKLAQQGDHVTGDQFKAGLAEVRTEIAALETRLIRWMVGTVLATAALTFAILRFLTE